MSGSEERIYVMNIIVLFNFRTAIGSHEICFFDLASVTDSSCSFSTYYKNIKSPIVCLAWHPTEVDILAFATLEGRVRKNYYF